MKLPTYPFSERLQRPPDVGSHFTQSVLLGTFGKQCTDSQLPDNAGGVAAAEWRSGWKRQRQRAAVAVRGCRGVRRLGACFRRRRGRASLVSDRTL